MSSAYSKRLIEVLNLVAAEANVQVSIFPRFVHVPDEIAAEISDAIEYAPVMRNITDSAIINVLSEIDMIFDSYVGKKEFWTLESMEKNSTWNQLRLFARKQLEQLGLPQTVPNLFWVTYSQQQPDF